MSTPPASTANQSSPSPQAHPKAQGVIRKPIRRPVSGSVSSQPSSPQSAISQTNTVPSSRPSEYPAAELAGPFSQGHPQPMNNSAPLHGTMSQRSSISDSPSYNGVQEDKALSTCKFCNHCKSGELANNLLPRWPFLTMIRNLIRRFILPMPVLSILLLQQLSWGSPCQPRAIFGPTVFEKDTARRYKVREELLSMSQTSPLPPRLSRV